MVGKLVLAIRLPANAYLAEAQEDTPAIHWPAEIHLRPKAREHEQLVDLVMNVDTFGAGKDLVIDHFALGVQRRFQEQAARARLTVRPNHAGNRERRGLSSSAG